MRSTEKRLFFRRDMPPEKRLRVMRKMEKSLALIERCRDGLIEALRAAYYGANDSEGDRDASRRFIVGLISTFGLMGLMLLNLIVAEQVMELFVPGTNNPPVLPGVGPIEPLALLMAGILTVAECTTAVIAWEEGKVNRAFRMVAGVVWATAVGLETYGAWLRGQIMGGVDPSQGAGGPLTGHSANVSALIGFIAPMAESILSVVVLSGILIPLGFAALRIPRMVYHWLSLGIHEIRYGSLIQAIWTHPEVLSALDEANQFAQNAENLLKNVQASSGAIKAVYPDKSDAGSATVQVTTLHGICQSLAEIWREYQQDLSDRQTALYLLNPTPNQATATMSPGALKGFRRQCRRLEREVDNSVSNGTESACASSVKKLRRLALLSPEKEIAALPTFQTVDIFRNRWSALSAQRMGVLTRINHALASNELKISSLESQQANWATCAAILIKLDGEPTQEDAEDNKAAEPDAEELKSRVVAQIGYLLFAELPQECVLAKIEAAIEGLQGEVVRLRQDLNPVDAVSSASLRPDFDNEAAKMEIEKATLLNKASEHRAELRSKRKEASYWLRSKTLIGSCVNWCLNLFWQPN